MSKFSLSSLMNKVPQQPLSISIFYIQPPLYKEGKKYSSPINAQLEESKASSQPEKTVCLSFKLRDKDSIYISLNTTLKTEGQKKVNAIRLRNYPFFNQLRITRQNQHPNP